jgi:iron complex transport system ATP-binding protein
MAYVPQSTGGILPFTCREFVLMARFPHFPSFGGPRPSDEEAANKAMEETATIAFANRPIDTLSGGERQRVFIAAALAQETTALVLDEPTASLDPKHHMEILALLRNLNQSAKRTLICATHDLQGPSLFGGRVLALRCGAVVFDGPVKEAMSSSVLRGVYDFPFREQSILVPDVSL